MERIRIISVEDDPDYHFILKSHLSTQPELELLDTFTTEADALNASVTLSPDIILIDLNLGNNSMEGASLARKIRLKTDAKVIILTGFDSPETIISSCRASFASAYVLKQQLDMLIPTILATYKGVTPQSTLILSSLLSSLTAAEQSVFENFMGYPIVLHSTKKTISNQQSSIIRKMGLDNKEELYHIFSSYFQKTQ